MIKEFRSMKKNVVVIFGGDSSEHDVSCLSATTVIKNMDTEKYNVILVGITKEGKWLLVDSVKDIEDGSWREGEVKAFISPDTTTRSLVILAEGTYKLQKVDVIFQFFSILCFRNSLRRSCTRWFYKDWIWDFLFHKDHRRSYWNRSGKVCSCQRK